MRVKYPLVHWKEKENPWVTYTKQRTLRHNNSLNLVVTGTTGSGKSWGLLSYFCLLDPDFELDNNFFFRAKDLMFAIKSGYFKSGKIWGYDEAGIDANNLNYFDVINKGLNALFQTARHRNYVFGLTLPFLNMLSKGVRCLMNAHWEAQGWNRDSKTVMIPRTLEYNGEMDKFYRKRLLVKKGEDLIYCNRILLPKPPKKITKEYEKVKSEFTQALYDKVYKEMDSYDKKLADKSTQHLLSDREEVCLSYLKEGMTVEGVAKVMEVNKRYVYVLMRGCVKKGIVLKGLKGDNNKVIGYTVTDKRE